MFKLALCAGHGINTAGKRCLKSLDKNETREWWLNNRVCQKLQERLSAYEGIEIKRMDDVSGKTDVKLSTRTKTANTWGADLYLSVHHNAGVEGGKGGGIVALTYLKVDDETKAWQNEFYNALIDKTGLKGNRAKPLATKDLAVCRDTKMPSVLLELGFMDSATDVPIILTEDFAEKSADALAEVIVKKANLKKKAAPTVQKLYRVRKSWKDAKSQLGAFASLDNAIDCCKKAGAGYKVYDWDGKAVYEFTTNTATATKKSNEEIAREVIQGKWGNGTQRKEKLKAAGYDYNAIQKIVNKLL